MESGPYLNPSKAHYKMAIRCLTFFEFSCFRRDIADNEIKDHIRSGEYLWLEYAHAHWLEHVQLGSKADYDSLQRLNGDLRRFFGRWNRTGACKRFNLGNSSNSVFGCSAFKEISSETYQMLVSGAVYNSQKRFHDDIKGERYTTSNCDDVCLFSIPDPFTLGDFARYIVEKLADQASSWSGLDNRQNLENLYESYGANLFKCQSQYCPFSVKGFRFKAECDLHSKVHEKKFKCHVETCNYLEIGFLTASELRLHVSRHSTIETTTDRISNLRVQDSFRAPRERRSEDLFEDAIISGKTEYVASAIEADRLMIMEYRHGKSKLRLAIENNQVQIVALLLDTGADIRSQRQLFKNPLEFAVEYSSREMVQTLLLSKLVIEKK